MDLLRRENALLLREVELLKRERTASSSHVQSDTTSSSSVSSLTLAGSSSDIVGMKQTIPEFDPSQKMISSKQWTNAVENLKSVYCWNDKTALYLASSRLVGAAQRWLQATQHEISSWEQLKEKLLIAFPSFLDEADVHFTLARRRKQPSESIEFYFYDIMAIAKRADVSEQATIKYIINGLDNRELRNILSCQRFECTASLLSQLKWYEDTSKLSFATDTAKMNQEVVQSEFRFRNRATVRCYNCEGQGHLSKECPQPQRGPRCNNCNKSGHTADKCNVRESATKPRVAVIQKDKFHKIVKVNREFTFTAFIDLGSDVSLIKLQYVKLCQLPVHHCNVALRGFAKGVCSSEGYVNVNLQVDKVCADTELYVVPDDVIDMPILIGRNFIDLPTVRVIIEGGRLDIEQDVTFSTKYNDAEKCSWERGRQPTNSGPKMSNPLWNVETENTQVYPSNVSSDYEVENFFIEQSGNKVRDSKNDHINCMLENKIPKNILRIENCDDDKKFELNGNLEINECEINMGDDLSSEEQRKLLKMLNTYRDCFAKDMKELGCSKSFYMDIILKDNKPIQSKPYRVPYSQYGLLREIVDELIINGIVKPSVSPYASPAILIPKKTGDYRMCIDFRRLNKVTEKDNHPIPVIEDLLTALSGSKFFIGLDFASGYYQIPISETSRYLTSFITPEGQYEFTRMPFGLVNAPSVFQRIMNSLARRMNPGELVVYFDDVLIPCNTFSDGLRKLERFLIILRDEGLTLKLSKSYFFKTEIEFLGYDVGKGGIRPSPRKIEAVQNFEKPTNVHTLRQFLGLTNFFRKFVQDYATIARPLTELLRKETEFIWTAAQDDAFNSLKNILTRRPLLTLYDPELEHELHTDASALGLAAILMQREDNNILKPVSYFSRQTTDTERHYHSYELETLAVVEAITRFRTYLLGKHFKVITDCEAIRATANKKDVIPRIARWWLKLMDYSFDIEYRQGRQISHVDALSRNATTTGKDPDSATLDIFKVNIDTEDWLTTIQRQDAELQEIINALQRTPSTPNEAQIHNDYKLERGRLFRNVNGSLCWVVPKGTRWKILKSCHDDIGHYGIERTLELLRQHFWFPRMRNAVKNYLKSCVDCVYHKQCHGKLEGELHNIQRLPIPFHTVHMDHLGPFQKTSTGNTNILGLIDGFTRYIILKAVRNTTTAPVIKALDEITQHFGVPTRVITDRGTAFSSKSFQSYCKENDIIHTMTAARTPRGNGLIERYNRTILAALSTMTQDGNKWDKQLRAIQWGLNSLKNATTKKTPHELLFGFNPRNAIGNKILLALHSNDYFTDDGSLHFTREIAANNIMQVQQKQKRRFDAIHKHPRSYEVGDLVVIERPAIATGESRKLDPKYKGPYIVSAKLGNDGYKIEDIPHSQVTQRRFNSVYSSDKMKPWCTSFDGNPLEDDDYSDNYDDISEIEDDLPSQDGRMLRNVNHPSNASYTSGNSLTAYNTDPQILPV